MSHQSMSRRLLGGVSLAALCGTGLLGLGGAQPAMAGACGNGSNSSISAACTGPYTWSGGALDVTNSGVISTGATGVAASSAVGTLTNSGRITSTTLGIKLHGGGSFTAGALINNAGGTISTSAQVGANVTGINVYNATLGTLSNSGLISSFRRGIDNEQTINSLINAAGGTITANSDRAEVIDNNGYIGTLSNAGVISATGTGSNSDGGGGAAIAANPKGIANYRTLISLTNSGTISVSSSGSSTGIYNGTVNAGAGSVLGTLTNTGKIIVTGGAYSSAIGNYSTLTTLNNSGTISESGSGGYGVFTKGAINSFVNSGTISSSGAGNYAIYDRKTTITTLTNSGLISATGSASAGIYVTGTGALRSTLSSLTNSGTISGDQYGLRTDANGSFGTIVNSGLISGNTGGGIAINTTGAGNQTITNQAGGTITGGSSGVAIALTGDAISTTINVNGGVITGSVTAAAATNTSVYFNPSAGFSTGGNFGTSASPLSLIRVDGGTVNVGHNLYAGSVRFQGGTANVTANVTMTGGGASGVTLAGGTLNLNGATVTAGSAANSGLALAAASTVGTMLGSTGNGNITLTGGTGAFNMNSQALTVVPALDGLTLSGQQQDFVVIHGGSAALNAGTFLVTGGAGGATWSARVATAADAALGDVYGRTIVAGSDIVLVSNSGGIGVIDLSQTFFTQNDAAARAQTVTFDGGTLRPNTSMTVSSPVTVRATGGVINPTTGNLVLTGTISAAGPLVVSGSGTVTIAGSMTGTGQLGVAGGSQVVISGSVSSSGGALVQDGLLQVNGSIAGPVSVASGGTLRGTGTVSGLTAVSGVLSPGGSPGTLTFAAPVVMQSGSTLSLDIDGTGTGTGAGNYSRAIISAGNSFTAAGTIAPKLRGITYSAGETPGTNSYSPPLGQRFAGVVQADGGISGGFAGLVQPDGLKPGTRFDAIYTGTSIDLVVTPASYGNLGAAGLGSTRNQSALGDALDRLRPAAGTLASGDLKTVFDALAPLDAAALPAAMTQVAGQIHPEVPAAALEVGRAFGGAVAARLDQVRGDGPGLAARASNGLSGLSLANGFGGIEGASRPASAATGIAAGDAPSPSRAGVWTRAFGTRQDNGGDGNHPGFRRTTGAGIAGIDTLVTDSLRAGVSAGYARSEVTGNQSTGSITADSYHLGVYAAYTPGAPFVDGDLGVTYNRFGTRRDIAFGTLARTATGKTSGFDAGAGVTAGYRLEAGAYTLEPSLSLRYDAVTTNDYTESGAGALNLSVKGGVRHAVRGGLGGRVTRTVVLGDGLRAEPELRARWEHDVLDRSNLTGQSLNGSGFSQTAARPGRDAAVLGTGIAAVLDNNLRLYASYDAEVRANQTGHTLTAGLRYNW